MPPEVVVDARGLRCPLPVLRAEKALGPLRPGATVLVLATDPIAKVDIPLYCTQNGHACTAEPDGESMRFTIVKAG